MTWAEKSLERFRKERRDREILRQGDAGLLRYDPRVDTPSEIEARYAYLQQQAIMSAEPAQFYLSSIYSTDAKQKP